MAVWGIGTFYKNPNGQGEPVTNKFIQNNCACTGWEKEQAPTIHTLFNSIKINDVVYLKKFYIPRRRLTILAVGIVTDTFDKIDSLGYGVSVKWIKSSIKNSNYIELSREEARYNVYRNTIYQEYCNRVLDKVIAEIPNDIKNQINIDKFA